MTFWMAWSGGTCPGLISAERAIARDLLGVPSVCRSLHTLGGRQPSFLPGVFHLEWCAGAETAVERWAPALTHDVVWRAQREAEVVRTSVASPGQCSASRPSQFTPGWDLFCMLQSVAQALNY